MAEEFSESWDVDRAAAWLEETQAMRLELNSAWQMVRLARESQRENPRQLLKPRRHHAADEVDYYDVLNRIDESISHLRTMTRTMREAAWALSSWDQRFREGWVVVACDVGEAIADPDGDIGAQGEQLEQLIAKMSAAEDLPTIEWPAYGAMLSDLRHIINIFADVTSARDPGESTQHTDT